jgi:hypothetical protein
MVKKFVGMIPWQLSLLAATLIVVLAGWLRFLLPCHSSFLIGICELARLLGIFIHAVILGGLFLLAWLVRRSRASPASVNRRIFSAGAGVSLLVLAVLFVTVRTHPDFQPHAMESLREQGRRQIVFLDFQEDPVYDPATGFLSELRIKASFRANRAGTYTVHPIRLSGPIPASVLSAGGSARAAEEKLALAEGEIGQLSYRVWVDPIQVSGRTFSPRTLEQYQAASFHWNAIWTIEERFPFPLFLFGRGAYAQVYPDSSGEVSFVTHVHPGFRTRDYPREVIDIR